MTTEPAAWTDEDDEDDGPDRFNLGLAVAALALLSAAAWLRFGPGLSSASVRVGHRMPPTRISGLHDAGSRLLLGMEGRVLWLVFRSAEAADSGTVLAPLARAWERLGSDPRFGMAVAVVDVDSHGLDRARAALEPWRGKLPLYLVDPAVPRSFGVDPAGGVWHFLVDPHGRIAAIARGTDSDTVDRLARTASDWLDSLGPTGDVRFRLVRASAPPSGGRINIVVPRPRG